MQKHRVNAHEDKEKNLVSATFDLPGVNRENISVGIRDNLLTVSGELKSDLESDGSWDRFRERRFGWFLRSFLVSEGVKVR